MKPATYAKRFFTLLFVFSLIVIVSGLPVIAAHAAPLAFQDAPPADPFADLVTMFQSLTGVALLISAIINALKTTGIIKDGDAPAWSVGFNLAGMVLLFGLQIAGKADLVPVLDTQANGLSQVLTVILSFAYQIFVTRISHENVLSGLPVIGKTYSGRTAGSSLMVDIQQE
jgi:hypothetical protein